MATNGWTTTKIGNEISLQRGYDITKATQRPGRVPVVSAAGILSHHDTALFDGPGVIIGRKGNGIGRPHYVNQPYWPHDTSLFVKDFHGNHPKFVYYFFKWMFPQLNAMDVGSANPTLNRNHVHLLKVLWPPLASQERIADILGTLDDKIELNRRMNETLEAMARRLFKSWFVDFDPVHAKAALRREHPKLSNADLSRRALPNMAPEIAELFPDSFEDSTLGPIPTGWRAGVIGDLATLDKSSVKPSAFPDEVFDHYSIPAFDDGRNPVQESGDQIKSNKFVVTPECVLLTKLNPRIPRVWLPFPSSSRRSLCSTEFLVLKPKDGVPREFLFSLVSSGTFFEVYETMVTGTSGSHQRIRPEHLLNMEVVIPAEPVRTSFSDAVSNQFTHSESLRSESRRLATTRDRFLPKLLAGDLSVSSEVAS